MGNGMNQQFIQFDPRTQKFRVLGKCRYCEEPQQIDIPVEDARTFGDWWEGEDICIQDATPNTPAEQRALLISGICPKCWGEMFDNEGGDT